MTLTNCPRCNWLTKPEDLTDTGCLRRMCSKREREAQWSLHLLLNMRNTSSQVAEWSR